MVGTYKPAHCTWKTYLALFSNFASAWGIIAVLFLIGSGALGHYGLAWAPVNSLKSIFAFCDNERECVSLFNTHFLSLPRLLIRVNWEDTSKIVDNTITLPLSVLLVPCSFYDTRLVMDFALRELSFPREICFGILFSMENVCMILSGSIFYFLASPLVTK